MKKLFLLLCLFPSVGYCETYYPNNQNADKLITYQGSGEATYNSTNQQCSRADITYRFDETVTVHLTCNIDSGTLYGKYSRSDDSIIKIEYMNFSEYNVAQGICQIKDSDQKISCYGNNSDQGYSFKFEVTNY